MRVQFIGGSRDGSYFDFVDNKPYELELPKRKQDHGIRPRVIEHYTPKMIDGVLVLEAERTPKPRLTPETNP